MTVKENKERDDISKNTNIGLMGIESINNNKRSINGTLRNIYYIDYIINQTVPHGNKNFLIIALFC